jgi:hypothetical protein
MASYASQIALGLYLRYWSSVHERAEAGAFDLGSQLQPSEPLWIVILTIRAQSMKEKWDSLGWDVGCSCPKPLINGLQKI